MTAGLIAYEWTMGTVAALFFWGAFNSYCDEKGVTRMNFLRRIFWRKKPIAPAPIMRYPPGQSMGPDGVWRSNHEIAERILAALSSGEPVVIPNSFDAIYPPAHELTPAEYMARTSRGEQCPRCKYHFVNRQPDATDGKPVLARKSVRFCPHCGLDIAQVEARAAVRKHMIEVASRPMLPPKENHE